MDIKTDKNLDVAYVKLKKGKVRSTVELRPGIIVDLDQNGQVLGIEVLSLTQLAPMLRGTKKTAKKKSFLFLN